MILDNKYSYPLEVYEVLHEVDVFLERRLKLNRFNEITCHIFAHRMLVVEIKIEQVARGSETRE